MGINNPTRVMKQQHHKGTSPKMIWIMISFLVLLDPVSGRHDGYRPLTALRRIQAQDQGDKEEEEDEFAQITFPPTEAPTPRPNYLPCEYTAGIIANDDACQCGHRACQPKSLCYLEKSICSPVLPCWSRDGTWETTAECLCALIESNSTRTEETEDGINEVSTPTTTSPSGRRILYTIDEVMDGEAGFVPDFMESMWEEKISYESDGASDESEILGDGFDFFPREMSGKNNDTDIFDAEAARDALYDLIAQREANGTIMEEIEWGNMDRLGKDWKIVDLEPLYCDAATVCFEDLAECRPILRCEGTTWMAPSIRTCACGTAICKRDQFCILASLARNETDTQNITQEGTCSDIGQCVFRDGTYVTDRPCQCSATIQCDPGQLCSLSENGGQNDSDHPCLELQKCNITDLSGPKSDRQCICGTVVCVANAWCNAETSECVTSPLELYFTDTKIVIFAFIGVGFAFVVLWKLMLWYYDRQERRNNKIAVAEAAEDEEEGQGEEEHKVSIEDGRELAELVEVENSCDFSESPEKNGFSEIDGLVDEAGLKALELKDAHDDSGSGSHASSHNARGGKPLELPPSYSGMTDIE